MESRETYYDWLIRNFVANLYSIHTDIEKPALLKAGSFSTNQMQSMSVIDQSESNIDNREPKSYYDCLIRKYLAN